MNPEYFDIENLKIFGMWPHQNFISRGIVPYIKRIRKDKVYVAVIGDLKGESIVDMLETTGDKIEKVYVINNIMGICKLHFCMPTIKACFREWFSVP